MTRTKDSIYIALFASITAVVSQITVILPFTPIPMNLGVVGGYVAGVLLGPKKGALSQLVYVLLGAIGLPVFANFSSGFSSLVGPSGGFLFGYILIAFVVGSLSHKKSTIVQIGIALTLGLLSCYLMGLVWFINVMQINLMAAFYMSILPFILIDMLKIIIMTPILYRLNKYVNLR